MTAKDSAAATGGAREVPAQPQARQASATGIRHPFETPPDEGAAVTVAPGLLWMRLPLPMALDHVNVYALDDGDAGWTVIDTGLDTARSRAIWDAICAGPLQRRRVWRVIVTHYHPDHIGLAGWFQARGAELWTTRSSWLLARMLVLDVQDRPAPETVAYWRSAGVDPTEVARRETARPFNFADVVAPLPLGYRRIVEGQTLRIGSRDWTVRIGHGHAPEHATLWSHDGALILGGDQLLPGISPNLGVYATEPDADPVSEWLASCAGFAPLARSDHLVLPGHKLPYTGLPFRLAQLAAGHHEALARLLARLATPATAVDCFVPLFRRDIGAAEHSLALAEAVAHLNHLLHAGRVTRTRRADGAWLWQRIGDPVP